EVKISITKLKSLQHTISRYRNDLETLSEKITLFKNASIFPAQETDLSVKYKLDSLNLLWSLSNQTLKEGIEVQNFISEKIEHERILSRNQESKYIWSAPKQITVKNLLTTFKANNQTRGRLVNLLDSDWGKLFLLFLVSGGFFYWQYRNNRILANWNRQGENKKLITNAKFTIPAYSFVFFLSLLPLFAPQIPTLGIQL